MKLLKDKTNRELLILLLSIALGGVIGFYYPNFMSSFEWVGQIFMNTLMALVMPLIFLALISAITSMGDISKLGSLGKITMITIFINVCLASLVGLLLAYFLKPGEGVNASLMGQEAQHLIIDSGKDLGFTPFVLGMFPANLLESSVRSQILPIVVFGVFFSIIALRLSNGENIKAALKVCNGFKDIVMGMINFVMKFTPIAMFALIGNCISCSLLKGHFSEDMLGILRFLFIFFAGCLILCIVQFFILYLIMGKKAFSFLSKSLGCITTGFATASSLATLPVILVTAEKQNINEKVSRFSIPLTAVFNLGSTALYVAVATLFVTQVLKIEISSLTIFVIYVTTVITGLGTTGIPNAGFIATITVLKTISVPSSAVAILFPIDAILGRVRTSVNVWGHLVCAQIINVWQEKKQDKVIDNDSKQSGSGG